MLLWGFIAETFQINPPEVNRLVVVEGLAHKLELAVWDEDEVDSVAELLTLSRLNMRSPSSRPGKNVSTRGTVFVSDSPLASRSRHI